MKILVNCKGIETASIRVSELFDESIPSNLSIGKELDQNISVDKFMITVAKRIANFYTNKKVGIRLLNKGSIGSLPNYHGYVIFVNEDFPESMISHLITWDFIDPDGGNIQFEDLI